jgi:hypothetical protein
LHSIIGQHYDEKRFELPLETRITGDITKKFPGFFADKQSFADFLATRVGYCRILLVIIIV